MPIYPAKTRSVTIHMMTFKHERVNLWTVGSIRRRVIVRSKMLMTSRIPTTQMTNSSATYSALLHVMELDILSKVSVTSSGEVLSKGRISDKEPASLHIITI